MKPRSISYWLGNRVGWRNRPFAALSFSILLALGAPHGHARAAGDSPRSPSELKNLSIEELLNMEIISVSRHPKKFAEAAAAIQIITHEEIRRSGATSIPEALRLASNLQVAQIDSNRWAISARGFNETLANKLLVMIDGRTIYTPLHAGVYWDVQDTLLDHVERIEVISGPGGTLWGANAVNGVINIITKSARDTQGGMITGGAGTQLRDFGASYGGALGDDAHFRAYAKYFDRDSTAFTNGTEAMNAWRMRQTGFRADWGGEGDSHQFTLQGDVYSGSADQRVSGDIALKGGNLLGRWSHNHTNGSSSSLQVYYDQTSRHIPDVFSEDLGILDVDFQYHFRLREHHQIAWGLGYRLNQDDVTNRTTLAFLPAHVNQQLFSAFLQDEITLPNDDWRLVLGSKLEHNDYTGFELQPSGRLSWNIDDKSMAWASVSRAIRAPSRVDRDLFAPANPPFILIGGADFVSEKVLAYEVGYRVQPQPRLSMSLNTFYNVYDDLRSLKADVNGVFQITNDVKGQTYGVELTADYQLADWWKIGAGFTYLHRDIEVGPGVRNVNNAVVLGNDPRHQFLVQSMMDLPNHVSLDWVLRYVASLPAASVPSYYGLDMRLAWKPSDRWELSITGQNLLDSRHPEFGTAANRQEIERGVFGKFTWHF